MQTTFGGISEPRCLPLILRQNPPGSGRHPSSCVYKGCRSTVVCHHHSSTPVHLAIDRSLSTAAFGQLAVAVAGLAYSCSIWLRGKKVAKGGARPTLNTMKEILGFWNQSQLSLSSSYNQSWTFLGPGNQCDSVGTLPFPRHLNAYKVL